jgi:phosphohistidine phosphatase
MTKQLLVMRHAKSSWDDANLNDYRRPLNQRGLHDAPRMAEFVSQLHCLPKLIASSSALRAKQTAELFRQHCPAEEPIELLLVDEFYLAPARVYLKYLSHLNEDSPDSVMVVGHNPGLEELVGRLSGESLHFPTAAIAHFTIDVDNWSEIASVNCELKDFWCPKEVL